MRVGDVVPGDYLIGWSHFPSENPSPMVVSSVKWDGHSRSVRKLTLAFREVLIDKDASVLVHRKWIS